MFPVGRVAYGSAVDFVVPVTTDWVPTTGMKSSDILSLGGSSSATALIVGLVSLVWSQHPAENRAQIMGRLRKSASLTGITDSGGRPPYAEVGFGIPNAYLATGGSTNLLIQGPTQAAPGETVQLTAVPNGTDPINYTWSAGTGTGNRRAVTMGPVGTTTTVTVTGRDPKDGNTLSASHAIDVVGAVNPSMVITMYSVDWLSEFPIFFDGSAGDHVLNGGIMMVPGCEVINVQGVRICHGPWRACTTETMSAAAAPPGWAWGFSISRDSRLDARSLETNVHWWHDGFTEIRVKAVYKVRQPAGTTCSVPGKTQLAPL